MLYARVIKLYEILEQASIPWRKGLPDLAVDHGAVWTLATPVRDADLALSKSRFCRSIASECNDGGKQRSLVAMVTALSHGIRVEDYQAALKDVGGIGVKEAFSFDYRAKKEKVWELKFQNKDRMYFFTRTAPGHHHSHVFLPLLFHHKKDQNTPDAVKNYCAETIKPFLNPAMQVTILK